MRARVFPVPQAAGEEAPPSRGREGYWFRPRGTRFLKLMVRVHLWVGLVLGVYLGVIGLTGSLVVFRGEIEDALHPGLTRVAPGTNRAPVQLMLEAARAAHPGARFHTVNLPTAPDRSLSIWGHDAGNRSFHVYFNPWTGALLGYDVAGDNVTEWLYELHANLLGGSTGEKINGIGAFLFVVLCLSGMVVWWPGWGLVKRNGLTIQWRSGWRRLDGMNHVHVDPRSGEVLRVDLHRERTPAQRMLRSFFPLHTGTFGGLTTRILWVIAGLAPGVLAVTGYWMWWKRVVRQGGNQP